jgi:hypothetical protein
MLESFQIKHISIKLEIIIQKKNKPKNTHISLNFWGQENLNTKKYNKNKFFTQANNHLTNIKIPIETYFQVIKIIINAFE